MAVTEFGVREVRIEAFRSARSVKFAPGRVCVLVGGPSVGKSNVLAAI
jgi:predicted ATPase